MLLVGITGKGSFFQMYSHSIRYGGYLWLYLGMIFYVLFLVGLNYCFSNWFKNKKYKKIIVPLMYIPAILLMVIHFIRDFT